MTNSTGQSDIDRVRDATDLVRLIGEQVALRPRGREHVGLCPFHDDHRPSMAVVTHKEHAFYNCFACGASGDCFRFVMDYHKMEFGEALRYLAERAGVTLEPRRVEHAASSGPKRADLLAATEFANDFFRRTLTDPQLGADARAVIATRGISEAMVEQFQIGAAPPGYENLQRLVSGRPSSLATAGAAGLLRERSGGDGHYDVFRNRLMFPICDEVGRVIAFGGRIIDPEDTPKYLNSPESPLFDKSRTLYGLHLARRPIIDARQAIVTEGYTDVIACHQAGIPNVIGTLGTALTARHAHVLSRLADSVVLVFDADEAGRKAADRGVEVFFQAPVDVRICVLPDGLDPDSLLAEANGPERFRHAIEHSVEALDYKLSRFESSLASASGLSARQKHLVQFLDELGNLGFGTLEGVRKAMVLNRLAEVFRVPVGEIERALPRRTPRTARTVETPPVDETPTTLLDDAVPVSRARRIAEQDLLCLLLFEPECASEVAASDLAANDFSCADARRIAEVLLPRITGEREITMPMLLADLTDDRLRAEASRLYFVGQQRAEKEENDIRQVQRAAIDTLHEQIRRERTEQHTEPVGVGPGTSDAEDAASVLEQLRSRERLGHRPAAIWQGVRT